MKPIDLKAPWEQVRERLKENDIHLTDEDLDYRPGEEEQLLARLSRKWGKEREEVKALLESISANTDAAG